MSIEQRQFFREFWGLLWGTWQNLASKRIVFAIYRTGMNLFEVLGQDKAVSGHEFVETHKPACERALKQLQAYQGRMTEIGFMNQ